MLLTPQLTVHGVPTLMELFFVFNSKTSIFIRAPRLYDYWFLLSGRNTMIVKNFQSLTVQSCRNEHQWKPPEMTNNKTEGWHKIQLTTIAWRELLCMLIWANMDISFCRVSPVSQEQWRLWGLSGKTMLQQRICMETLYCLMTEFIYSDQGVT